MEASQIASHKFSDTEIYKFGGASLQNPERVKQVIEIIKNKGSKPLLECIEAKYDEIVYNFLIPSRSVARIAKMAFPQA